MLEIIILFRGRVVFSSLSHSQTLPIKTVKVSPWSLLNLGESYRVDSLCPRAPVYSECLPQTAVYLFSNPLPTQKRFLTRGISAVASDRVAREFFFKAQES